MLPNMRSRVPARRVADITRDLDDRRTEAVSSSRRINHSTVTRPGGVRVIGDGSIETEAADGSATRLANGVVEQRASSNDDWGPLPPAVPVEPAASPAPEALGATGVILVRWTGVENETAVVYDVHVSATSGFTPDASTLLTSNSSTQATVRTLADGTPLDYETTYYIRLVARSGDLAAAPSVQVAAEMDKVRSADLRADAIDGMTITGATIRTASAGMRTQLDEIGVRTFAPDGTTETSRLSAEAGGMRLDGGLDVAGEITSTGTGGSESVLKAGSLLYRDADGLVQANNSFMHTGLDGDPRPGPTIGVRSGLLRLLRLGGEAGLYSGVILRHVLDPVRPVDAANKQYVDSLAAPVSASPTVVSPFAGSVRAIRQGNQVRVTVSASRSTGSSQSWTILATLPVGYTPTADVALGAAVWFATTQSYQLSVFADGTVRARMSTANNAGMAGTLLYETNDPMPF